MFAFWGPWQLVETGDWRLIRHAEKVELFRLDSDPDELHDVAATAAGCGQRSDRCGDRRACGARQFPTHKVESLPSDAVERMRALGYLPQ